MEFSASAINKKVFKIVAFRGYRVGEVDDFLDQMAAEADKLQRANKELEEKVRSLQEQLARNTVAAGGGALEDRIAELEKRLL